LLAKYWLPLSRKYYPLVKFAQPVIERPRYLLCDKIGMLKFIWLLFTHSPFYLFSLLYFCIVRFSQFESYALDPLNNEATALALSSLTSKNAKRRPDSPGLLDHQFPLSLTEKNLGGNDRSGCKQIEKFKREREERVAGKGSEGVTDCEFPSRTTTNSIKATTTVTITTQILRSQ
jgi:hypothetical protein